MTIPDDGRFPIVAWAGPNDAQLNPPFPGEVPLTEKTMADLAEAGFNISLLRVEYPKPGEQPTPSATEIARVIELLDISAKAKVRLLVGVKFFRVTAGTVKPQWKTWVRGLIAAMKDHPGLYGYYVADEPRIDKRKDLAAAMRFVQRQDPNHLAYVNHWMNNMSYAGYRSYEELWDLFGPECKPDIVSMDCYPFGKPKDEDWRREVAAGNACYFPRHQAKLGEHYFETMDILRQYSRMWDIPMWHFTLTGGALDNTPEVAEGEMRFQLMTGLAYGAKGLQYFTYALGGHMMNNDLTPNANWHIARKINREVHAWAPVLRGLRSIGVYHYPCNLPYTRPLDQYTLGNKDDLCVRGDAAVLGQFTDADGGEYALIVNRTPYEKAKITMKFGADQVEELSPVSGQWSLGNGRDVELSFEPGQGRLFRFHRKIELLV